MRGLKELKLIAENPLQRKYRFGDLPAIGALLNIYATEDHLVPPAATIPLNDLVGSKDKELYSFKGGHIGVFAGGKSQKELAPAVTEWLKKRDK